MNSEKYVIRTQSDFANNYGVGEKQAENVYLFRTGDINLTLTEAQDVLRRKINKDKVK